MEACKTKKPFQVNKIIGDCMVSVAKLVAEVINRKVNSEKKKLVGLQTHEIKLLQNYPFTLYFKKIR